MPTAMMMSRLAMEAALVAMLLNGVLLCLHPAILQSGGGGGLSAQIGALQQSWRANAPADFARTYLRVGAVAVRYAHLAATAMNMRTGGGTLAFVGASECRGPSLYPFLSYMQGRHGTSSTASRALPHASTRLRGPVGIATRPW